MQINQNINEVKWTWADLVSSYRFWALFIFFIAIMSAQPLFSMLIPYWHSSRGISNDDIPMLYFVKIMFTIISIFPAWLVSRAKYYYPLYLFAGLLLIGLLLLCFIANSYTIIMVAVALLGFSIGGISLLIPAYIARAVNSTELFILSFGIISTVNMISDSYMLVIFSAMINNGFSFDSILILLIVLVIIGTLFLFPIKKCLFNESPKIREVKPETPSYLDSLLTFLLFFIPFYFIFWFYKIHKDIRYFSQSATLLTPLGASLSSVFVPFAMPIMFSILNDVIQQKLLGNGEKGGFKTGLVIVISLFFPPIAAAMVQSGINKLANVENNHTD